MTATELRSARERANLYRASVAEFPFEAFGWQAARTRRGTIKAVGTGPHAGQKLYGKKAEEALNQRGKRKPKPQQAAVDWKPGEDAPPTDDGRDDDNTPWQPGAAAQAAPAEESWEPEERRKMLSAAATLITEASRGEPEAVAKIEEVVPAGVENAVAEFEAAGGTPEDVRVAADQVLPARKGVLGRIGGAVKSFFAGLFRRGGSGVSGFVGRFGNLLARAGVKVTGATLKVGFKMLGKLAKGLKAVALSPAGKRFLTWAATVAGVVGAFGLIAAGGLSGVLAVTEIADASAFLTQVLAPIAGVVGGGAGLIYLGKRLGRDRPVVTAKPYEDSYDPETSSEPPPPPPPAGYAVLPPEGERPRAVAAPAAPRYNPSPAEIAAAKVREAARALREAMDRGEPTDVLSRRLEAAKRERDGDSGGDDVGVLSAMTPAERAAASAARRARLGLPPRRMSEMAAGFLAEFPFEAFGWSAAKTRGGGTKAVGTGEHAGRTLYGKRAQAALSRKTGGASQPKGAKKAGGEKVDWQPGEGGPSANDGADADNTPWQPGGGATPPAAPASPAATAAPPGKPAADPYGAARVGRTPGGALVKLNPLRKPEAAPPAPPPTPAETAALEEAKVKDTAKYGARGAGILYRAGQAVRALLQGMAVAGGAVLGAGAGFGLSMGNPLGAIAGGAIGAGIGLANRDAFTPPSLKTARAEVRQIARKVLPKAVGLPIGLAGSVVGAAMPIAGAVGGGMLAGPAGAIAGGGLGMLAGAGIANDSQDVGDAAARATRRRLNRTGVGSRKTAGNPKNGVFAIHAEVAEPVALPPNAAALLRARLKKFAARAGVKLTIPPGVVEAALKMAADDARRDGQLHAGAGGNAAMAEAAKFRVV